VTVDEAKAKIFHWLCSRYHEPGKGNEYIDKDIVRDAINIPREVFEKALNEFVDSGAHDCVEVEIPTGRLRLGLAVCAFVRQERIRLVNQKRPARRSRLLYSQILSVTQRDRVYFKLPLSFHC
jgi:hypothetical protein